MIEVESNLYVTLTISGTCVDFSSDLDRVDTVKNHKLAHPRCYVQSAKINSPKMIIFIKLLQLFFEVSKEKLSTVALMRVKLKF